MDFSQLIPGSGNQFPWYVAVLDLHTVWGSLGRTNYQDMKKVYVLEKFWKKTPVSIEYPKLLLSKSFKIPIAFVVVAPRQVYHHSRSRAIALHGVIILPINTYTPFPHVTPALVSKPPNPTVDHKSKRNLPNPLFHSLPNSLVTYLPEGGTTDKSRDPRPRPGPRRARASPCAPPAGHQDAVNTERINLHSLKT